MRRFLRRPSPAMAIATVALVVALGGTGYAATQLARNSVGSAQIRRDAVTSSKVKNRSLEMSDLSLRVRHAIQNTVGPQGPTGPTGPTGATGQATGYARVQADGTLDNANSGNENKGVAAANVQHVASSGVYCFGGLSFTPASVTATADDEGTSVPHFIVSASVNRGSALSGCDANHQQARVTVVDVDGGSGTPSTYSPPAAADQRFFVWFER